MGSVDRDLKELDRETICDASLAASLAVLMDFLVGESSKARLAGCGSDLILLEERVAREETGLSVFRADVSSFDLLARFLGGVLSSLAEFEEASPLWSIAAEAFPLGRPRVCLVVVVVAVDARLRVEMVPADGVNYM